MEGMVGAPAAKSARRGEAPDSTVLAEWQEWQCCGPRAEWEEGRSYHNYKEKKAYRG